jgi:hypothetical protein
MRHWITSFQLLDRKPLYGPLRAGAQRKRRRGADFDDPRTLEVTAWRFPTVGLALTSGEAHAPFRASQNPA